MTIDQLIGKLEEFRREHGDLPVVFENTIPEEGFFNVVRDSDLMLEYDDGPKHPKGSYDPGRNAGPDNCPDGPWLTLRCDY